MAHPKTYCLDANVFIGGWTSYYSMALCPSYWNILSTLAAEGRIFAPMEVRRELEKIEDDLFRWVKERDNFFREPDQQVQIILRDILRDFERLVDDTKQRSLADPWVIAHAKAANAVVVTKEQPSNSPKRIKIPDVCRALGVPWMDDFQFCQEIGIRFEARIESELREAAS